jgi:hypothetical protein
MTRSLEVRLQKEGYIPVMFRLLQLTARVSTLGSANLSKSDWKEFKKLAELDTYLTVAATQKREHAGAESKKEPR